MIKVIQLSQVNFSTPGSLAPVDHWHNDSIAYAGVVVISDMEGMKGGERRQGRLGGRTMKEKQVPHSKQGSRRKKFGTTGLNISPAAPKRGIAGLGRGPWAAKP